MSSEVVMPGDRPLENWPDKEFLETMLRKWLGDPKINVTEFTSRIATNKGDNYTSDMYRVTIKCEYKKDVLIIVIKRIIRTGPTGELFMKSSAFIREKQMVKTILPEMHAVLKKVVPDVEPFGPAYIYSSPGVLAMEDLQPGGFRMAQRRLGLDLNHISLVIRTLARCHATSVLLMENQSVDVSMLRESFYGQSNGREELETFCNGMLATLSEELKTFDGLEKYSAKVSALFEQDFLSLLVKCLEDVKDTFMVISHGDLWTNNIMFRYSSTGEPDGVRFVDWQTTFITNPCVDLQYFLITSSNETVRTKHFDQLIEEYHEMLCETMAALNCSTQPPTLETFRKDFDKCTHFGILAALTVLPMVLEKGGMFDFDDMIEKGKPQNAIFRGKPFRQALEWFLPLFERKGFI